MSTKFADNLRRTLKDRGISNEEIAEQLTAHPVTISKLLNGKMKLTEEWMKRFAVALKINVQDLMGEATGDSQLNLPIREPRKTLPVYGLAAGSIRGHLTMSNDPVEWVNCPQFIETVRGAYALIVTGSSMEPRYFAGEVIFLHPNRPPRQGDHVVIQEALDGGTAVSVKRFDHQTETHVITTQYNPLAEVKFDRKTITAIHRVLTPNEVSGA